MQSTIIIISFLYGLGGIIGLTAFIPTILDLIKKIPSANIKSYIIWTSTSFITFLYAYFVVEDLLFKLIAGFNFILCLIVLILALNLKYRFLIKNN